MFKPRNRIKRMTVYDKIGGKECEKSGCDIFLRRISPQHGF
jgi:hypothetical protein